MERRETAVLRAGVEGESRASTRPSHKAVCSDSGTLGRPVLCQSTVGHHVQYLEPVRQDDDVSDQPSVATPPHILAAHDRDRLYCGIGQDTVQRRGKRQGPSVRGICCELRHGPPPVSVRFTGRDSPPAAEALVPAVTDTDFRKPGGQGIAGHLRVDAAAREPPDVDDEPHVGAGQPRVQLITPILPVADREQWHGFCLTRPGTGQPDHPTENAASPIAHGWRVCKKVCVSGVA